MDRFLADLIETQAERALARRVPVMDGPRDVAQLRRAARMTQVQFARAIGTSVWTVRQWEQGRRKPTGLARTVLRTFARDPGLLR